MSKKEVCTITALPNKLSFQAFDVTKPIAITITIAITIKNDNNVDNNNNIDNNNNVDNNINTILIRPLT